MKRSLLPLLTALMWLPATAVTPPPMADTNGVVDNTPDSILQAAMARPVAGSTRVGENPVLFLVGNSTMRTGTRGDGNNGQWGWGYFFPAHFDRSKITVENHALGGMSSRTFYRRLWADVCAGIRPGDYVMIELGHNDNGPYASGRARASIPGTGRDSLCVVIKETGEPETVYSYGEYMRRYIADVRARGAHPLLLSLTPRLAYTGPDSTRIERVDSTYGLWAREIADETGVPFIDLNDITATKFERFGRAKTATMFYLDKIHTSEFGARENARSAAEGLRRASHPLAAWLLPEAAGEPRDSRPALFIVGNDMAAAASSHNDTDGMDVRRHTDAATSARALLESGRWDIIYRSLRPGDKVVIGFNHADELPGAGPESKVVKLPTGRYQVVYTYGGYLSRFILDTLEKGAIPVVASPAGEAGAWALEVAARHGLR